MNDKNNSIKVEGNTNLIIQDTSVEGSITINLTDYKKLDEILNKYKDELKQTKDIKRKQEIKQIIKSIKDETASIRNSVNKIKHFNNKILYHTKITTIFVILIIFSILGIFVYFLTWYNSDKFNIEALDYDAQKKYVKECCAGTKIKYCDTAMSILFDDLKTRDLKIYREFYSYYFSDTCKYNFSIKKTLEDSIANKEFIEINSGSDTQKKIKKYEDYKNKYDSTKTYYKTCWDSLALLKLYYTIKQKTYNGYKSYIEWCETCDFKGTINIDSLKGIALSNQNTPKILIIGEWIDNNESIWKFENTTNLKKNKIDYEYEIRKDTLIIKDLNIKYNIESYSEKEFKLKKEDNTLIHLKKK